MPPAPHKAYLYAVVKIWGVSHFTEPQVQDLLGVDKAEDGDKVRTERSLGKYAGCSDS